MYHIEPTIPVWLQFPAMPSPVEVRIPWNALPALDRGCRRRFGPNGAVIYSMSRERPATERTLDSVAGTAADANVGI